MKKLVDGISHKRKRSKRKSHWLWLFVVPIIFSLLLVGKISAAYILPNLNLASLFRDGKFLIIFQNNTELRSSGGFIGSYAVAEVQNFEVKNLSFNTNIYALDNAFAKNNRIEAPKPVAKMLNGQTWALRDANYDASFVDAAQDVAYFYELETGDKIDGVIGINAKVLVDILQNTGPVKLDKSNITITADNFYQETQNQIERIYYQNPENRVLNEPKSILKEMYPEILSVAMKDKIGLYNLVKTNLAKKEIIFYFKDQAKQELIEKYNFAGKIPIQNENNDYLYINSNSYSGNKSSISLKNDISYKLTQTEDYGPTSYLANLKITRIHKGSYDWPDGKNLEWLRIYLPNSAQFISAKINEKDIGSQVEISQELDKINFGTEVTTEPGQANIIEFNYLLPYESKYKLLVQKQPGATDNFLTVNLDGKMLFDGILDRDVKISN